jgi:hypothetical protein
VLGWSALAKAYLEALASLPPPPRFELSFLLFRTTLGRELNRVGVGVHTEAFGSYLLGLKCINSCRQTQLQVACVEWLRTSIALRAACGSYQGATGVGLCHPLR